MKGFWTNQRERISQWGLLRTLSYYVFGVAAHKVGIIILDAFEYPGHPNAFPRTSTATFSILESMADWTARDLELLQAYPSMSLLPLYPGFFAQGDKCAVARCKGSELASVCWIHATKDFALAPNIPGYLIQYGFTLPDQRGKGLFTQTLAFAGNCLRESQSHPVRIFVDCLAFNYASKRGILNAGYEPVGRTFTAFKHSWVFARPRSASRREPDVVDAT